MVKFVNLEVLLVVLSVLVQLPLAIFLGHYYDQRSFLDTGYLVSAGFNPYQSCLITVFTSNSALMGPNPIIGYPPLWPLLLGLIYRLTFNIAPNLLLYNFATKIPIIAANIGLAYLTAAVLRRSGASDQKVRAAWLFLLFNPFTFLTTAAWGEYDTLIALLCVASLYFLSKCMIGKSSILLSLSLVLKPISLPLIGLPLICSQTGKVKKFAITVVVAFLLLFGLWFLPFYFFGWMVPSSDFQFTSYFRMAGGLTVFNAFELFTNVAAIPTSLWFLGYIWIPALLVGYYFIYRNPPKSTVEVVRSAAVLMLIFFLTRSWLSEPNLNLLFPLILIAFSFDKISSRLLHLAWIIPLAFMFFNWSIPQLLFLIYPQIMTNITAFDVQFGTARFVARFVVTILWYILAFKILFALFPKNRSA
jgi:hypothetical protein